jgi:hypothetical protein
MKYFLHDTNSFNDEKVTELFIQHGFEGVGLFYTILERLAAQEKPIKTSVLKTQLHVGKRLEKCWQFMEQIGIISSNNGETFNERILSYSEKYQIKKKNNRDRVERFRMVHSDNEADIKSVTHYTGITERTRNARKVKESKVKESKVCIEKSETHTHTQDDIEFNKVVEWMKEKCPRVLQMKEPLTQAEYFKLKERFEVDFIPKILQAMHNWSKLTKERVNAYLTFLAFAKRDQKSDAA